MAAWVPYRHVPPGVWDCPLPLVAVAPDWNLLGHTYRAILPRADRVLTDAPGVEVMAAHGIAHARPANLFGLDPAWLDPSPAAERDIDVLFVGNLHPAVQRDRAAWLGRLADLGDRFHVVKAFRDKWGDDAARGYRLPDGSPVDPDPAPVLVPAEARSRPWVSLTMIVKNEERNLPQCLESVAGLADEVVVVDTGSTDRTREVARSLGATVSEFPWVDHFAAARNAALDRATGEWIFWMDADDRLDADNRPKLAALFAELPPTNAAYVLKCVCVADGPGGTSTAVDHVRVFRNDPRHRWKYRVHEQILPSLRATGADVRWSGVSVHHVGYVDAAVRRRKLDRDLRLLELERQEQPDDPFTLFNLGSVYHELGDLPAAVAALEGSLTGSHPRDSIVRKLYALLAQCHKKRGDRAKAVDTCRAGRVHYPDDAELLFVESNLLKESGDARGAESLLLRLVHGSEGAHFGSVDTGLRGHKARHNLGVLYSEQGRHAEAAAQWRAALTDEPSFVPAHVGLGEVYLTTRNWAGLDRQVAELRGLGAAGEVEAAGLTARGRIDRGEFAAARAGLAEAIGKYPSAVGLRVVLSHAYLRDGTDLAGTERALRGVLALDPDHPPARHNLELLLRNTGRWVEGVFDNPPRDGAG